jgi:hypothetical protein
VRASNHFEPACVAAFYAFGRVPHIARAVASRFFVLHDARGSWQRGGRRKRLVLFTQATIHAALPGFQSAIVFAHGGVTVLPSNISFKADGFAAA